jgi:hypothetical protein
VSTPYRTVSVSVSQLFVPTRGAQQPYTQPSVLHIQANDVAVPSPYHCTTVPLDDIFVPSEMI